MLGRDPVLGFTPGLRVPGGEGYEIAVRAVLTQQISVRAACTHAGRLVAAAGEPLARPRGTITHLFPTAEAIAAAPDAAFAMPARRRDTLRSLAGAPTGRSDLAAGDRAVDAGLRSMRALRDRDAWLPTDLGVRHALDRARPRRRRGRLAPVPRLRRHPPLEHALSSRTMAANAATSGEASRSRQASAIRSGSMSVIGTQLRSGRP